MNTKVVNGTIIHPKQFPELFAPRAMNTHKGSFGTLGIIGGGVGMIGAVLLAGRAALKMGAGKVLVGFAQPSLPLVYDAQQPELMLNTAEALYSPHWGINVWVAGCGCGHDQFSVKVLNTLFSIRQYSPIILDADGLNILAQGMLSIPLETGPIVMTPHPAEAGRLLKCSTIQVQKNRPDVAQQLAQRYQAWVVLKGAATIVCNPEGEWQENPTGNPGLATAGTGDVLAGILGALLAQGISIHQAIPAAVWLHGAAADYLVAHGTGPIGLTASELVEAARYLRNNPCTQ